MGSTSVPHSDLTLLHPLPLPYTPSRADPQRGPLGQSFVQREPDLVSFEGLAWDSNAVVIGTCIYFSFHRLTDCKGSRRKVVFSRVPQTPAPTLLCGALLPSPLRKDLRSGRPPGPSAGGSCPSSSTPSGSDFPGFSFGFCGYREGAGTRPGPIPHADRGQPPQLPGPDSPLSAPFS